VDAAPEPLTIDNVKTVQLEYVLKVVYSTYMTKLTLSVDQEVVERAKRYAATRGTSVSRLVETYLDAVSRLRGASERTLPSATRRLRGILKGGKYRRDDYIDYLERKYR
jgi:transcription termination factor Rho